MLVLELVLKLVLGVMYICWISRCNVKLGLGTGVRYKCRAGLMLRIVMCKMHKCRCLPSVSQPEQ